MQSRSSKVRSTRRRSLAVVLAAMILPLSTLVSHAEYRLEPGDVLEISASSMAAFRQRIAIELDGTAAFPIIGEVNVGGRLLSEVRAEIRKLISSKEVRIIGNGAGPVRDVIFPEEVTLSIAEYRPIFVSGDVANPGTQAYRPGLTIRQAVAVAGGYRMAGTGGNALAETIDQRAVVETTTGDLTRERFRLAALQAELAGKPAELSAGPAPAGAAAALADLETTKVASKIGDAEEQRKYLNKVIDQMQSKLDRLVQQEAAEEEGAKLDASESEKIQALFRQGVVPSTRAEGARRVSLLSSTRLLQTGVELDTTRKQVADFTRQLQQFDADRRAVLLEQIVTSTAQIAQLELRLKAATEKAVVIGGATATLTSLRDAPKDFAIIRKAADKAGHIKAEEDADLEPGDSVDVTLIMPPVVPAVPVK
jgi:polysaccharide export outer membrane protein